MRALLWFALIADLASPGFAETNNVEPYDACTHLIQQLTLALDGKSSPPCALPDLVSQGRLHIHEMELSPIPSTGAKKRARVFLAGTRFCAVDDSPETIVCYKHEISNCVDPPAALPGEKLFPASTRICAYEFPLASETGWMRHLTILQNPKSDQVQYIDGPPGGKFRPAGVPLHLGEESRKLYAEAIRHDLKVVQSWLAESFKKNASLPTCAGKKLTEKWAQIEPLARSCDTMGDLVLKTTPWLAELKAGHGVKSPGGGGSKAAPIGTHRNP